MLPEERLGPLPHCSSPSAYVDSCRRWHDGKGNRQRSRRPPRPAPKAQSPQPAATASTLLDQDFAVIVSVAGLSPGDVAVTRMGPDLPVDCTIARHIPWKAFMVLPL